MSSQRRPKSLPTLARRRHPLAATEAQRRRLAEATPRAFSEALEAAGCGSLQTARLETLQINLGKRCNQTCHHCHVDAGPDRQEVMTDDVLEACLGLIEDGTFATLDITGGAPEMHPRFEEIVTRACDAGAHVMDRTNLTILDVPRYRHLVELFAERGVEIVASLPWYTGARTEAQRGEGVFDPSIEVLRRLNKVGYGRQQRLPLHLVTNPIGAYLLTEQAALERDYKRQLEQRHGVVFDRLYVITNMPVSRFLEHLEDHGDLERYLTDLVQAFNPAAVEGLMCRNTLSVGYDGKLYDCDFNQMLDMHLPLTITEVDSSRLMGRDILTGAHCFGCTAGAGSSCGGAIS